MGRDNFHQTRILPAPSNFALNTSREGTGTISLGNLGQGLTTFIIKNYILIHILNLPSFNLKPLPFVLSLHTLVKSPSPALSQAPSGTGRLLGGLPGDFASPGWTAPALPAFPPSRRVPAFGSLLVSPLDPMQLVHIFPVLRAPELDTGLPGGASPEWSRRAEYPPLTFDFSWCSPGYSWPSGLWAHIANSCWACHPPAPLSPPLGCSQSVLHPACACSWACPNPLMKRLGKFLSLAYIILSLCSRKLADSKGTVHWRWNLWGFVRFACMIWRLFRNVT